MLSDERRTELLHTRATNPGAVVGHTQLGGNARAAVEAAAKTLEAAK
ncbi:hypothetical protein ACFVYA_23560 [Amycolatopsis sp. NPDC058278]